MTGDERMQRESNLIATIPEGSFLSLRKLAQMTRN
jgi:hypothetical protein